MQPRVVEGDLLDQPVEAIVNAWNRNIIPWWLLLPHGVSGAIKKRAGIQPFVEVGRFGPMPLGTARHTSAGRLPFKHIIHVAGINMWWTATEYSIKHSVLNAMRLAEELKLSSLAFPVIGAGAGGFGAEGALKIMLSTFESIESDIEITIVKFKQR